MAVKNNNIGPKISVDGYAKYHADMKSIVSDTKTLKSEMQALENQTDETGRAQDTYRKQVKNLNDQIDAQVKAVNENEAMLAKAEKTYGKNSEEAKAYRTALANSNTELYKMRQKLDDLGTPLQNFGESMKKAGEKVTDAGKKLSTYVTAPLVAIGAAAVDASAGFEDVMANVQALGQLGDDELDQLSKLALSLGSSTRYSAEEVGEGMGYMALAGWDTEAMLAGILPILNLATVSGEDLGTTSDIVTDALTAFGLSADDAGHFVDVLAKASSSSNTTVSQMGNAFKYAAALAGTFGYSVEDIALALGLMANAGIKGEQAGTTLRAMITKLASPTKDGAELLGSWGISIADAEGNARPFAEVIGDLRVAFQGLAADQAATAAASLVGTEAMSGFLSLMNTEQGSVNELTDALEDCDGAAQDMADTMNSTTKGALTKAKNAVKSAASEIGKNLAPYVVDAADAVRELAEEFGDLDEDTKKMIVTAGAVAAAIGPVTTAIGGVTTAAGNLITFVAAHPLAAALTVAGVAVGWTVLNNKMALTKATTTELTSAAKDIQTNLAKVSTQLETTKTNLDENMSAAAGMASHAGDLITKIDALTKKEHLSNQEKSQMKVWVDELNKIYPDLNLEIDENGQSLNKSTGELRAYIAQMKEMAKAEAYYEALVEAYKAQSDAEVELARAEKALKEAQDAANATARDRQIIAAQLVDSAEDLNTAQRELNRLFNEGVITEDEYKEALNAVARGEVSLNGTTLTAADARKKYAEMSAKAAAETGELKEAVEAANSKVKEAKGFADSMSLAYEETAAKVNSTASGLNKLGAVDAAKIKQKTTSAGKAAVQGLANGLADPTNRSHVISQKDGLVKISTINNGKHLGLTAGKDMVQGVANGLNNETKLGYVRSGAANVKAAATPSGTYDAGYNTGTNIMSGLIQGVADKMDDWRTQMQNVANAGINKVNNLFRVGSPSRVMMETGHYIGEGLAIGVQREVPTVEHAMAQLFSPGMYGARDFSVSASGSGGAAGNTVVNMTINGAPGQDVHELADIIEEQIAFNLRNREAAFA